jgi:ubiquinol-cytochrome c reductase cytochrome c1 subunit
MVLLAPLAVWAAEAGYRIDKSPHDPRDLVSLQIGARTFVNYCQGCHGAQFMRLNRLTELGLTEAQIRDNLMFTVDKVGETMKTAMPAKESKTWFGVAPPDLSVVARSRGPDWLYTYLRTFYRDPKTAAVKDPAGHEHIEYKWSQISQGALTQVEYDALARDLVNFLVYVGEPVANERRAIGIVVLFALGLLFIFVYLLKREFWKDVK